MWRPGNCGTRPPDGGTLARPHANRTTRSTPCPPTTLLSWLPADPAAALPAPPPARVALADVVGKFKASSWGQKLAKQAAKAATTDFDRYKAAVAKAKKARAVRKVFNALKKTAAPKKK